MGVFSFFLYFFLLFCFFVFRKQWLFVFFSFCSSSYLLASESPVLYIFFGI